uniref:Uncharacterized protein n=1 Tax=Schistocephalus solidus TaxID=70667 RepID=A0A0X3PGM3_SCHSO
MVGLPVQSAEVTRRNSCEKRQKGPKSEHKKRNRSVRSTHAVKQRGERGGIRITPRSHNIKREEGRNQRRIKLRGINTPQTHTHTRADICIVIVGNREKKTRYAKTQCKNPCHFISMATEGEGRGACLAYSANRKLRRPEAVGRGLGEAVKTHTHTHTEGRGASGKYFVLVMCIGNGDTGKRTSRKGKD